MLYIQANRELIDGQYITYCTYSFCKVVYDGFFRCNCMYTKIFGTNFTCYAKKDSIRSHVHCNIKNLYHKYKAVDKATKNNLYMH